MGYGDNSLLYYCNRHIYAGIMGYSKKSRLITRRSLIRRLSFFSGEQKLRLNQHYSRIHGTLIYWKNRAEKNRRFHLYTVIWTTIISISLPVLVQAIGAEAQSKVLLIIISTHSALLMSLHRVFKVERNYQSFRTAESEFYDLRRSFLDNPLKNKTDMDEAINDFFDSVSKLRVMTRKEEINNSPSLKTEK